MGIGQTLRFVLTHPMNRGSPVSALSRYVKWQVECRLRSEIVFDWIQGAKLVVRRGMTGATGNIYCGLHEFVDMRFVLDTLEPEELFVDAGANIGSYTVLASKVSGAQTISIEADPDTVEALRRNIRINDIGNRVKIVNVAVGAIVGIVPFTIGQDTRNRVASAKDTYTRNVTMRTLDDVLEGEVPNVIKIDVEGFETDVLKGAKKTLDGDGLRAIIIENTDRSARDILEKSGFEQLFYDPTSKVLRSTPLFESKNSLWIRGAPVAPC